MWKYLSELERDDQNLVDHLSVEPQDVRRPRGFPNAVFRTWRVSFEQIRKQEPRVAEILSVMAMLDRQQIPVDLVYWAEERDVEFRTALGTLYGYSLIVQTGDGTCTMHPLVQLSVQVWLAATEQKTGFAEEALRAVVSSFPNGEHKNWKVRAITSARSSCPKICSSLAGKCDVACDTSSQHGLV